MFAFGNVKRGHAAGIFEERTVDGCAKGLGRKLLQRRFRVVAEALWRAGEGAMASAKSKKVESTEVPRVASRGLGPP